MLKLLLLLNPVLKICAQPTLFLGACLTPAQLRFLNPANQTNTNMKNMLLWAAAVSFALSANAQSSDKSKRDDILAVKYRRSSLYKIMIANPNQEYAGVIENAFVNGPNPEKFNEHNLALRTIPGSGAKDESANITAFAEANHIARDIVAKWFNRSAKGGFDVELVKQRGFYDASALDIAIADRTARGRDLLADAGEDLIKNTFVLVSDFKYISKEKVVKESKKWMSLAGNIAASAGVGAAQSLATTTGEALDVVGKGYVVLTTAHLYRLDWNDAVAATFYNDLWADDKTITAEKKKAFDESNLFKLTYVGSDESWADVQSTTYANKSNEQLIERATNKALDQVIVKLQRNHEEFKTRTPLFSGEPLTAKIGLKEGIENGTKFEVMEQQSDENGKTTYVKVGTIKVDASAEHPIWDNRYGANEDNPNSTVDRTYFKKVSGKDLYPGMLIVQKK